ncbi:formate/nitrite transporter family protein [Pseudogulbenkiania subflava]|uniref:Formate/nitrite transporter n=1 Tax=Pseudogulbenkiania subflava DSM 22618 TaxID=1123014 RepID=A0A1Y6BWX7_9NEIS|nr:formate/nitrite transporter family protein [Pseudogulbenkiania subflava]SMF25188.1 formate/nitrite transporter [Pseudogulbenkiania subflava DSM 22618]
MALYGFDAFSPAEIAERVEKIGVIKAQLPLRQMALLGVLAGAFIGLGALYFVLVTSDPGLGFAAGRVLGGLVFSLGLLLVVVAGAELFTGNNLLAMAWADGRIGTGLLLRNWLVVCLANFVGAAGLALMVWLSGHPALNHGLVAEQVVRLAAAKCSAPLATLFWRGALCNVLVCLAVWMAMAGRSVTDKMVAVVFPISAFVAAGFEHSIANMYLIPLAMLLKDGVAGPIPFADAIGWGGLLRNLLPVIAGNLLGGSVLVALVYYLIYRRGAAVAAPVAAESGSE